MRTSDHDAGCAKVFLCGVWDLNLCGALFAPAFVTDAQEEAGHAGASDSQLARPLSYRLTAAVELYDRILAGVIALFFSRCPFAVVWRIGPVVVFSFYRVTRRCLAHVGQEVLEAVPAITNTNAASAVVLVVAASRVIAASAHPHPDIVFARLCQAVGDRRRRYHFPAMAPTAHRMPGLKSRGLRLEFCSALAYAAAHRMTVRFLFDHLDHSGLAEALAGQIESAVLEVAGLAAQTLASYEIAGYDLARRSALTPTDPDGRNGAPGSALHNSPPSEDAACQIHDPHELIISGFFPIRHRILMRISPRSVASTKRTRRKE